MEVVFYIAIFVMIVLTIAGFVQSLIFPPQDVIRSELPEVVEQELNRLFPGLSIESIRFLHLRHRYLITGQLDDRACQIAIDVTPDNELAEIDFSAPTRSASLKHKKKIAASSVPPQVGETINELLHHDGLKRHQHQAFSGLLDSETAYQIEVQNDDYEYRFIVTAQGRLIRLEKTHHG